MDEKIKIKMTATTINAVPLTSSLVTAAVHLISLSSVSNSILGKGERGGLTGPDQPLGEQKVEDEGGRPEGCHPV